MSGRRWKPILNADEGSRELLSEAFRFLVSTRAALASCLATNVCKRAAIVNWSYAPSDGRRVISQSGSTKPNEDWMTMPSR